MRHIVTLVLFTLSCSELCYAMEIIYEPPTCEGCLPTHYLFIPNSDLKLIWEHYCMKHIKKKEWHLARLNKALIEWQLANKKAMTSSPERYSHFKQKLDEAEIAKNKAGDAWGCNPHEAKLALAQLVIGRVNNKQISNSFISNTPNLVLINTMATIVTSNCNNPKLEWILSIPKYNLEKSYKTEFNVSEVNVTIPDAPTGGLSDDETIVYVDMSNPGIWEVKSPTYSMSQYQSDEISSIKHSQSIPEFPYGDRGNDFSVAIDIKLFCNDSMVDRLNIVIGQDDKDQLRQEYVDMKKAVVPEREELKPYLLSKHFTSKEFNFSKSVAENKYENILCKILLQLEAVKKKAGGAKMILNSGFRNPYKNAIIGGATESRHIYGDAVDIRLTDFNNDGSTDKKDWYLMSKAAKKEGACVEPNIDAPTWIHMDWRGTCPNGW